MHPAKYTPKLPNTRAELEPLFDAARARGDQMEMDRIAAHDAGLRGREPTTKPDKGNGKERRPAKQSEVMPAHKRMYKAMDLCGEHYLHPTASLVFLRMVLRDTGGGFFEGPETTAEAFGITAKSVRRARYLLRKRGLIRSAGSRKVTTLRGDRQRVNMYRVNYEAWT